LNYTWRQFSAFCSSWDKVIRTEEQQKTSAPAPTGCIKVVLPLVIAGVCLFEFMLHRQASAFREFEAALLSLQWMLLDCLAIWCGTFLFLTFRLDDLPIIGLLLIATVANCITVAVFRSAAGAVTLLAGITLGKFAFVLLRRDEEDGRLKIGNRKSEIGNFLVGLVVLLAFASWWHLDMTDNFYHGPRWMGLWNNPNDYGLLMGAGVTLAIGLMAAKRHKRHREDSISCSSRVDEAQTENTAVPPEVGCHNEESDSSPRPSPRLARRGGRLLRLLRFFAAKKISVLLLIAALMMGVGLVMSYSRGAWVGTAVGLLYLAKSYGKFKWRWVLSPVLVVLMAVCFLWNNTPDNAPWFVKRMDLGRASAQHRVAAWKAALLMMRDHPFGVGWNKAVETYAKEYSPPEDGAGAITTNDYLMLGTQLGIPGLVCFVAYVGLCLRSPRPRIQSPQLSVRSSQSVDKSEIGNRKSEINLDSGLWTLDSQLRVACRSAAIAMLVAFWFDGGLFKLATASVFWILLELGAERQKLKTETLKAETIQKAESGKRKAEIDQSLVPPSPCCGATSTSAATQ
jgi:hypothetical protein